MPSQEEYKISNAACMPISEFQKQEKHQKDNSVLKIKIIKKKKKNIII